MKAGCEAEATPSRHVLGFNTHFAKAAPKAARAHRTHCLVFLKWKHTINMANQKMSRCLLCLSGNPAPVFI
ncbi:hypothetical protein LCGC14_1833500 [marine sediment metagenome]|uniref:Uncharacterized protein n=1 Tax=marine sediment metagenome TaxID=412755 RepID=A0A0F9H3I4_9ZZZZ